MRLLKRSRGQKMKLKMDIMCWAFTVCKIRYELIFILCPKLRGLQVRTVSILQM